MKRIILSIAISLFLCSCVATVNSRRITVIKDTKGNIISKEIVEEQQQQKSQMPFRFKYLDKE